jgi:hypothetical protein
LIAEKCGRHMVGRRRRRYPAAPGNVRFSRRV